MFKVFLLIVSLVFFPVLAKSKVPSYQEMESKLKETWDAQIPVPYTKIVKKDLLGKGIVLLRGKKRRRYYLYTFLVYLPRYKEENKQPVVAGKGKILQ
ncbi:MAG: hypothetical protein AAF518_16305 [Spirochaetota bacterium]